MELFQFAPLAEQIWALRGNLTTHNVWCIALACPLATLGRKLTRAPGPACEVITPSDL